MNQLDSKATATKKKAKAKDAPVNIEVASKSFIDSAKKSIGEILSEQFEIGLNPTEIKSLVDDWSKRIADGEYTVTDVKDTDGYNKLVRARALFRTTRTAIDKKRKELKAVPNEMGKAIDGYAKGLTELVEPIELLLDKEVERVDAEKERIKIEKEKADQAFMDDRIKQLIDVGCAFDGSEYTLGEFSTFTYDIRIANEEEFVALVDSARVEALKLADKKAETERLLREEDERRAKELQEIELGKKLHAEAEKKLQAEKGEFERKQKEELEKFFKEKQELERQKQELIESKRLARTQQLTSIGYKLEGRHFQFMNKYGTSHLIEVNCIILDDEQWGSVVEQAIIRKKKLLSQEEERDEQEEKDKKEIQEKAILEQRTKDRIAQLEEVGFKKDESNYVFSMPTYESIVTPFILEITSEVDWFNFFFATKASIDSIKKEEIEKAEVNRSVSESLNDVDLIADANKVNEWIGNIELAVSSLDSSLIQHPLVASEVDTAKLNIARAIESLKNVFPK
jgi:hypothetical protein